MRSDTANYVCVFCCFGLQFICLFVNVFVALWPLFYIFTVNFTHVNITDENLHRFKKRARYLWERKSTARDKERLVHSQRHSQHVSITQPSISLFFYLYNIFCQCLFLLTTMNMMRLLMAMAMSAPDRSLATLLSYCISCY